MNDYLFNFSLKTENKTENYEIQLTPDKANANCYSISGQQAALAALGLQPSSSMTLADLQARFRACNATNIVCEQRVHAAALQVLAPDSLTAHLAKIEKGIALFDPKAPSIPEVVSLETLMTRYNVPGVSVAICDHGAQCHKGYGELKDDTCLIQAASVSKMITALTVLSLVKDNVLSLEDDVSIILEGHWAANLPLNDKKITIEHLLSHTAGMTSSQFDGYPAGTTRSTDEIIQDVQLDHLPDKEHFAYSGGGTMLLQKVIELKCGNRPFADIVEERVFTPLGMDKSTYAPEKEQRPTAMGHGPRLEPLQLAYPEHAAAGLWSTPDDLIKVVMAIQKAFDGSDESIITQPLAQKMLTAQTPGEPNGLGVFVNTLDKSIVFSHQGANAGFQCILVANNAKQGACIMTNSDFGQPLWKELLRTVAKECVWPDCNSLPMCRPLCTAAEVEPISDKSAWAKEYAGTYSPRTNQGSSIEVTADSLKEAGCPPYDIVHLGQGVCIFREFTPGPPDKFYFTEDALGTRTLHVFGKEFVRNTAVASAYASAVDHPEARHAEVGMLSPTGSVTFARLGKDEEYGAHRIGSVTKTFTTFLALKLVHDGLLSLDTTCEAIILPKLLEQVFEDPKAAASMTLAQLLSHTSGLELDDHCRDAASNKAPSTLQERFIQEGTLPGGRKYKHIAKPGDNIGFYSNAGLAVAGWMIEAAYNKKNPENPLSFSELMKKEIFNGVFTCPNSCIATGPSGDIIQSPAGDMTSSTADLMNVALRLQKGEKTLEDTFGKGWQTTMLQPRDIFQEHGLGCTANASVLKHAGLNRETVGTEERDVTALIQFPLRPNEPGLVAMCDSSALGPAPQEQRFIRALEASAGISNPQQEQQETKYNPEFSCPPNAHLFHGNAYFATNVDPFATNWPDTIICSRNGMKHQLKRDTSFKEVGMQRYHDQYKKPWLFIKKEDGRKLIYSGYCLLSRTVATKDLASVQPSVASIQALQGVYRDSEKPDEHPTYTFKEENGHLFMRDGKDEESFPCLYIPDAAGGSWTMSNPNGRSIQIRFPENPDTDSLIITDIFTGLPQLPHNSKRDKTKELLLQ